MGVANFISQLLCQSCFPFEIIEMIVKWKTASVNFCSYALGESSEHIQII